MGIRWSKRLIIAISAVASSFVAAWLFVPPLWMAFTSVRPEQEVFAFPVGMALRPTLEHYVGVLNRPGFVSVATNSIIVSIGATGIVMVLATAAAYSIARFNTGGIGVLYGTLIFRAIPPVILGLPIYVVFSRTGLIDTISGLLLAYIPMLLPPAIWMMMAFVSDINMEIEEAALVDGCTHFGVFRRIVIPLVRPGLMAVGLWVFTGAWNQFFYALILTSQSARTLPLEASNLQGEFATQWGQLSAMGMLLTLPTIVVVLLVQRHLVRGISFGAVKG